MNIREKLTNDISNISMIKQANIFGGFMTPAAFNAGASAVANTGDAALKHLNYGREASALYEPAQTAKHLLNKAVDKVPFATVTKQTIGGPLVQPTTFGKLMRAGVRDMANPVGIPFKNVAKQTWSSFGAPLWKGLVRAIARR